MSQNPVVLLFQFLLEIAGLIAQGYWGWTTQEGIWRVVFGLGIPLLTATCWGVFRFPNEPGEPLVTVPGWVRLLLEACFFGLAVILLAAAGQTSAALLLAGVVIVVYTASYDRILRLLRGEIRQLK